VVLRDTRLDWLRSVGESLGPSVHVEEPPYRRAPDVDAVIIATPSGTHAPLARDALAQGSAVISTSDSIEDVRLLLTLDGEARRQGRPVVVAPASRPAHLRPGHVRRPCVRHSRRDPRRQAGTGGPSCARQHHRARGSALDWRDGVWVRRAVGQVVSSCGFPSRWRSRLLPPRSSIVAARTRLPRRNAGDRPHRGHAP
jgi:hypothetical protein